MGTQRGQRSRGNPIATDNGHDEGCGRDLPNGTWRLLVAVAYFRATGCGDIARSYGPVTRLPTTKR